jgi:Transposase domain (DUF772)
VRHLRLSLHRDHDRPLVRPFFETETENTVCRSGRRHEPYWLANFDGAHCQWAHDLVDQCYGAAPFDPVMMFKVLVIQTTNNLSDERAKFLINDRLSFMRFLGFGLSDRVPDARTIWLFREKLTKAGAIGPQSNRPFNEFLPSYPKPESQ